MTELLKLLLFCCLATVALPVQADAQVVKVGIYTLEPYLGLKQKQHGLLTALTVAALKQAGYQAKVENYPLVRLIHGLESGEIDLAPGITPTDERKRFMRFSEPIYFLEMGFLYRKGRLHYRTPADLRGLTGGVIRGAFWERELTNLGVSYETVAEQEQNIRKLIAGRIDFICLPRGVGFYLLRQNGVDPTHYEFSVFARDGQDAAISNRSRYPSLFDDFQRGLRAIKRNGSYDRIVAGFSD